MRPFVNVVMAAAISAFCLSMPGFAWEDPPVGTVVQMTSACADTDVILAIDFTVTEAPAPHFVGCAPIANAEATWGTLKAQYR